MASKLLSSKTFSQLFCFIIFLYFTSANAVKFAITNKCPYTVWAAAIPGGGKQLRPGKTWSLTVKPHTAPACIWPRTNCKFDGAGDFHCQTGDCGSFDCRTLGESPVTVAMYALNEINNIDQFFISLVEGFNVPLEFSPTSGRCNTSVKCTADINGQCPDELRVPGGCNSPCNVFKTAKYCCKTGDCVLTDYAKFLKDSCPEAYSYPKEDHYPKYTCPSGTNYKVVFCPSTTTAQSKLRLYQ